MIAGTIITTIGFFAIYALHSTQLLVSIDLAIVSIGLSFAAVGVMNIIIMATPARSMGISTGMTRLDKNYRKCYWSCDCWNASAITARNSKNKWIECYSVVSCYRSIQFNFPNSLRYCQFHLLSLRLWPGNIQIKHDCLSPRNAHSSVRSA